ncbi:MAG TPA: cysteine desulfurase family protein [Thermoguttaceae bacterium]|nr:cysteine desulfurase family protein [Thermoguttaceae bacterium]
MAERIYFDNAATTPLDPRVLDAMLPFLRHRSGNPSSLHAEGREAREAVDLAREQVARLLGARPGEVVFTAGGTESNALAIRGVLSTNGLQGAHVITSAVEHPAVLACCRQLEQEGVALSLLPVDRTGTVHPDSLRQALQPNTRLVSVMAANNVVGTLQPIAELARITHQHGAWFHTDAVQAVGKIPLNMENCPPIDLLSFSAHKFNGPKGVGALYVRTGTRLRPILDGGGQEGGLRSGTENVPGIVGLGAAAAIAREEISAETARVVQLRDRIIDSILARVPNAYLIGDRYRRLPGHVCFGFSGSEGEAIRLLLELDQQGIAISSGSACSAPHHGGSSHVLEAMGFDPFQARGSLRISLGRFNTAKEADRLIEILPRSVRSLRTITSLAAAN